MCAAEARTSDGVRLRGAVADIAEIAAFRGCAPEVRAIAAGRGWNLPELGHTQRSAEGVALCVRPERWLLLGKSGAVGALHRSWREALGSRAASLDASSALGLLHLSGPAWRSVLSRGCRIDLDPLVFAPGAAAATLIAQVPVTLAALSEGVLLLTPASTARHLREWLLSTSRPFGVDAPEDATVESFPWRP